jgi:hypothetical protein
MHINLIYETEQRSASPVSLKLALRVLAGAAIALGAIGLFSFIASYQALKSSVRLAEADWAATEPKHKEALRVRGELSRQREVLALIQGWRAARVEWGRQLQDLQPLVPPLIQLTELKVTQNQVLQPKDVPARVFELRVTGRTPAERAEMNVSQLQDVLGKLPPFDALMESVSLPPGAFRQDPLKKTDRLFEIACKYKPRALQ